MPLETSLSEPEEPASQSPGHHAVNRRFELPGIVPWGRRLWEYRAFFDLANLGAFPHVLDVGGGPASFASEAAALGHRVTAVDPLYRHGGDEIRRQAEAAAPAMAAGLEKARARFTWDRYGAPEGLLRTRTEALELFLADYEWGRACGRYRVAALPELPFADGSFDLAIASHLLFLYSEALDASFHLASLQELLRVAREVRIFPLLDLEGLRSAHLAAVVPALEAAGLIVEERSVPFEFQKGATTMLRLMRK